MVELAQVLKRLPLLFSILFAAVLTFYVPKNVLKRFVGRKKKVDVPDDSPTGDWLTAGVIYAPSFLAEMSAPPTKKVAASFTPYIEDYVLPIQRPKRKPFPNY